MKITVPPQIERALNAQARRVRDNRGTRALDSLRERFVRKSTKRRGRWAEGNGRKTLADFLKGYVGVLDSGELVERGPECLRSPANNPLKDYP